jgi:hypothetical protein
VIAPPDDAVYVAVKQALSSPCQKSKRGSAVYVRATGIVLGRGHNSQPSGVCDEWCNPERMRLGVPSAVGSRPIHPSYCSMMCVHAEARAVRDSANYQEWEVVPPEATDLVHVKTITPQQLDDLDELGQGPRGLLMTSSGKTIGMIAVSGHPSCWQCSREILDAGLGGVWLYHAEGWRRYAAAEFHDITLDTCDIKRTP